MRLLRRKFMAVILALALVFSFGPIVAPQFLPKAEAALYISVTKHNGYYWVSWYDSDTGASGGFGVPA